jgi:CubicO group peptidase (beta-lactamase class C family)
MRIKNILTVSILFLVFVFNCLPVTAQTLDAAAAIDRYLTARTELGRFNGAVLVAKDGKVVFRRAYGFADIENRVPYTPEMKQEVASVTKMFVSMSALMLRDKGKLKLEDPICNYLDDCPEAWKPVIIQHLMRHTSGIPDYEEKLELFTPKHVEFMVKPNAYDIIYADAKKLPLDFKPGEKFHYSNTAYVVLGHVIEKASGQSFNKLPAGSIKNFRRSRCNHRPPMAAWSRRSTTSINGV